MTQPAIPSRVPSGATAEGDGIVVGAGLVRVDAYIDFLCPFCRQFEQACGQTLATLVSEGRASIAYHPMNFLDEASTTRYSTRAAAASGCAADQDRFTEFAHALFVHQPPEGGPGLSDEELAAIGREVGLTSPAFTGCLSDKPYLDWPSYVTERASAAGVTGTPTVMVAGQDVPPEPDAIRAAVAEVPRLGGAFSAHTTENAPRNGWRPSGATPPGNRPTRVTACPAVLACGTCPPCPGRCARTSSGSRRATRCTPIPSFSASWR